MLTPKDFPSSEEILSREFVDSYRNKPVPWGFNGLGYIAYLRTYSRKFENGENETWVDTIERCIRGAQEIGACYTRQEAERLFDHVFNLRCNFAGRSLWQLGTPMVKKFCGNSLINCFFTVIEDIEDFCFVFENLMLGGGVTGSVRREHIHQLPKVKSKISITHENTKDADFIVPDKREGWVELLRRVLVSALITGKGFTYSTILIRKYGELIKSFGGTASGPDILIDGITNIVNILNSRAGKKLRSIDALDIFNLIASIVVAGNVRRSAELALGDADDILFLRAKRWDLGNIPNWRAMSNNTIAADRYDYTSNEFWNGYHGNGEPYGMFNLSLSQEYGRLIDGPMKDSDLYPQKYDNCVGTNPCLTKDTIIMTSDGPKQISELLDKQFITIINNKEYKSTRYGFFYSGKKDIIRIHTNEGFTIKCTPNHKFLINRNNQDIWIEANEIRDTDLIHINQVNYDWDGQGSYSDGWLLGNLVGDGHINDKFAVLAYWGNNKIEMRQYALDLMKQSLPNSRSDLGSGSLECKTDKILFHSSLLKKLANTYDIYHDKKLSPNIEKTSKEFYIGFLRGWFDADGTVIGNQNKGISIRLCSVIYDNLIIAQRMLQKLGIYSKIYKNRKDAGYKLMPDGHGGQKEYYCQSIHELVIARKSIINYKNIVGFADQNKLNKLINLIDKYQRIYNNKWFATLSSIESLGQDDVYDCTIPDIHCFDANGFISHNCSEISLADGEVCNLSELYMNNISSKEEMIDCATLLYKTQKAICSLNYLHEKTNKIVHKNMRIGIGITGICQSINKLDWLDDVYHAIRKFDKSWSIERGWNESIKLTTIKPSGTLSLLSGSTPGIHPEYDKYYIRRMRIESNSPIINLCRNIGYHIEPAKKFDGSEDQSTLIVEFPCISINAILAKDMTAIDQLNLVKRLQTIWADNAISITVYYHKHELDSIREWLKNNYDNNLKCISFLLHSEHGFMQAPYESITEDRYNQIISNLNLDHLDNKFNGDISDIDNSLECVGGVCPVR